MEKDQFTPCENDAKFYIGATERNVSARFGTVAKYDIPASKAADEVVFRQVPGIQLRVATSNDVSQHTLNPQNQAEFKDRFPDAWAVYEGQALAAVEFPVDLIGATKSQADKLMSIGIRDVSHVAQMSDGACETLGFGFKKLREKAQGFMTGSEPEPAPEPVKRKRGRPRKNPLPDEQAAV